MTKIRAARTKLGISQGALARRANLNPSNLSKYENGVNKAGESVRGRIADALGMASEALFDSQGWPLEVEACRASV